MGRDPRKPVFGVFKRVRFKPACLSAEASYNIEISIVASLAMILSNKRTTTALIRLRMLVGAFVVHKLLMSINVLNKHKMSA